MNHGLAEIFSAGLPLFVSHHNLAASPIVVDDVRMIDGEIVDDAIRIVDWIAATAHHVCDQVVCFDHRVLRIVDELRLHIAPRRAEAIGILARERPDRELLD